MDLNLTREQELLKKTVREFSETKIAPKALEYDEKGDLPHQVISEIGKIGLIGLVTSPKYGGSGMGHLARMIAIEETSRVHPSLGFFLQTGNLLMYVLENYGSEEQKKKYLPGLCQGNKICGFALTEPSGGSDPSVSMTIANPDADGYVINGRKSYISHVGVADVIGLTAKTGDRASVFIVEKNTPGFEVTRREARLGLRATPVNEFVLNNCKLPKENLVGEEGRGLSAAITAISVMGRTGAAGVALGTCQGAYEAALKFSKERVLYGKPIAALQAIQFMLVDMNTEIEAARWLCYHCAWLLDQGKNPREVGSGTAHGQFRSWVHTAYRLNTR
jgi:butyryl-CoA dehydrogenase